MADQVIGRPWREDLAFGGRRQPPTSASDQAAVVAGSSRAFQIGLISKVAETASTHTRPSPTPTGPVKPPGVWVAISWIGCSSR